MNQRRSLAADIARALGDRELFWGGLRSEDCEPLTDLPQFAGSFSIIGGRDRPGIFPSTDFEHLWGSRVDLDGWTIDDHTDSESVREFRNDMLHALRSTSALVVYRPNRFLSSVAFARQDRCLYLGMWNEHHAAFDHKPWVETSLASAGIIGLDWTYVDDADRRLASRLVDERPQMIRPSRSSGGVGLAKVEDPSQLDAVWPQQPDGFASISPFLEEVVPVNLGATVWPNGQVTLRHPSIQLIGIPGCTDHQFGYCGNDFGAASELDHRVLDTMDTTTRRIGRWLHGRGYRGTFGVDYLVHRGQALFAEVNPRFQGSTYASCRLSIMADEPCLMLDHLAALLGLDPADDPPLHSIARTLPNLASIVVHTSSATELHDTTGARKLLRSLPEHLQTDLACHPSVPVEPGGVLLRTMLQARVTQTGFALLRPWGNVVADFRSSGDHHESQRTEDQMDPNRSG